MPDSIIYQDTLIIDAPIAVVKTFITEAQRIYDYYPLGFSYENLLPHKQSACYGLMGASLLDLQSSDDTCIVLKVYNTLPTFKKQTADTLINNAFFTMFEDWHLQDEGQKTRIVKIWRQLEQSKLRFIPKAFIAFLITVIAKQEHHTLIKHWNNAANLQQR